MLKNYIKVAWRSLWRQKGFSLINIMGLAVGITCCILIMLYVSSEFSYDRFNTKSDRTYRIWQKEKADGQEFINTVTPIPVGPAIQSNIPEVESACRVYLFNTMMRIGNNSFNGSVTMVDPTVFTVFDFVLTQGNRDNPFPNDNTVIVTPAIAKKYFGSENAVGKTFDMQLGDNKQLFTVAGIAEPAPEESSIKYEMLISYANDKRVFNPRMLHNWFNIFNETYVLLQKNIPVKNVEKKFPALLKQQLGGDYGKEEFNMYLQPLPAIHLDTSLPAAIQPTSDPTYSYILGTIALLILLIACINFITLSVGRSSARALEVGVRKALGAARKQLIIQFWGEALLITGISVITGLLAAAILLDPFNRIVNRHLVFHFDLAIICFYLLLIGVIALIAGIYPAIVLSGFNAAEVLKGKLNLKMNSGFLRKGLITGQFTASIIMIICAMIIGDQLDYLRYKDLGYDKEQVIIVPTNKKRADGYPLAQLYKNELLKYPQVLGLSASTFSFAEIPWATLGFADDKKQYHSFQYNEIDRSFIEAMKIPIVQGRNFSKDNPSDSNNSILVNETLIHEYGIKDPIGKKFGIYSQQIIGVMKDFNYESLHTKIKPLVLSLKFDTIARQSADVSFVNSPQPRVSVRMKPGNLQENVSILKKAWLAIGLQQDFEYHFLDERLEASYDQEQKSATVVKIASALSVFIACMGLFGLATLTVTRRTKEIGIRKILGANVVQLVQLLSKDFILLVVIAALIAFPVAWWAMQNWLADFAYRTNIRWWLFLFAAAISIVIALVTVATQAIRAAMANPVNSIKTE